MTTKANILGGLAIGLTAGALFGVNVGGDKLTAANSRVTELNREKTELLQALLNSSDPVTSNFGAQFIINSNPAIQKAYEEVQGNANCLKQHGLDLNSPLMLVAPSVLCN